ncbi:MAG: aminotransferase class V-fold PLP-dependent enzyme [Chloroflexi bacterium]|nr:aminotransferase class V-fold PLP-dependent enzyme [Chloroflexota bacterium]
MGVYQRLGVQPVINARGMNTMASGSLMPRVVLDAMAEAATAFVDMEELNRKAGEHIAARIGVEAAHVTSGSAGGLLLSAAAVIAGDNPAAIVQLPDTTGLKDGIVIEKCRRIRYDQALRQAGARLIEVGDEDGCTPEQMEAGIDDRTAAIMYIVSPYLGDNGVPVETAIDIAHRNGLPIIVDGASTLPPVAHLTRWTDMGADLVIYSGGKGIRGPQGSGLLIGRKDLIRAVALNGAPNGAIGRPAKVSKEDIIGLVTAFDLFMETDWTVEWAKHVEEAKEIVGALDGLHGISAVLDEDSSIWTTPTILVSIDEKTGLTPDQVVERLRAGDPPILTRAFQGKLLVDPHNLRGDEASIVARRLREECSKIAVPVPA